MGLNKQAGNMYGWVTHTWNPIRGKCPHDCSYCYMKRFDVGELRLEEKELKTDLGEGNFIFVGSSVDMFADDVPHEWIKQVLLHCSEYPTNKYLFQTKNPFRLTSFRSHEYPAWTMFGTTIETNRDYNISKAPTATERQRWIAGLPNVMISIEPIMDFDLGVMVDWMKNIKPEFVSIGADSKGSKLPEPSREKVNVLIAELGKFTEVRIKPNLKRLME